MTSANLEVCDSSGDVRPRQGTEICNFAAPSQLDEVDLSLFSNFSVQFGAKIRPHFGAPKRGCFDQGLFSKLGFRGFGGSSKHWKL